MLSSWSYDEKLIYECSSRESVFINVLFSLSSAPDLDDSPLWGKACGRHVNQSKVLAVSSAEAKDSEHREGKWPVRH